MNNKIFFKNTIIAIFKSRFKRFFIEVDKNPEFLDYKENSYGYSPNVGKMAGVLIPGKKCLFTKYDGKLKWRWEAINIDGIWIGVNTQNPNYLIEVNLHILFPDQKFKREVTFGRYRCDFASEKTIIEVKNVHWKVGNSAVFPDCPTERGARQMLDLIELQEKYQCYVLFVVQRPDCQDFRVASDIDPLYFQNTEMAKKKGVKFRCFCSKVDETGIELLNEIPVL